MKGSLSCSSFEGLADTRLRRLRRKRMGPRFFCCYCRFVSSEEEEVSGLMEWIARVLTEEEREGEGRGGGGERADGMDGLFLFSPLLSSFPSPGGDASVAFFPHPSLPFLFSFLTWLPLQAGEFDIGLRVNVRTVQLNAGKFMYIFVLLNMFAAGKHRRDQETHYMLVFPFYLFARI